MTGRCLKVPRIVFHKRAAAVDKETTAANCFAMNQDGHTWRRILSAFPPMTFPISSSE
jgi:hypothetical protein